MHSGQGHTTIQHVYTETRAMQIPLPGRHSDWPAGVGVHAFSRGTLTEDEEVLELIQSWKQTQGDSAWGVILLWPWCGWRLGWMAGPWLGHGWAGGSSLGELLNPAKQMKIERKVKAQQKT